MDVPTEDVLGKAPLNFIVWYDEERDFNEQLVSGIVTITSQELYFSKEMLHGKIPIGKMIKVDTVARGKSDLISTLIIDYTTVKEGREGRAFLVGFEFLVNALYNLLVVCMNRAIMVEQNPEDIKKSLAVLLYLNIHDLPLWENLLASKQEVIDGCMKQLESEGIVNASGKLTPKGFSIFTREMEVA